jgi:hypothetical protein
MIAVIDAMPDKEDPKREATQEVNELDVSQGKRRVSEDCQSPEQTKVPGQISVPLPVEKPSLVAAQARQRKLNGELNEPATEKSVALQEKHSFHALGEPLESIALQVIAKTASSENVAGLSQLVSSFATYEAPEESLESKEAKKMSAGAAQAKGELSKTVIVSSRQPSPASSRSSKGPLRRGKWTVEEEAYVARVIQDFNSGFLDAPAGTTLRTYLSDKLQCDPMRITKKFTGDACIGKRVFHPAVRSPSNASAIDKAQVSLHCHLLSNMVPCPHLFFLSV